MKDKHQYIFHLDFFKTMFNAGNYSVVIKILIVLSRFTWELPQSIFGWLLLLGCSVKWEFTVKYYSQGYTAWFFYLPRIKWISAVSLGGTIIVFGNEENVRSNNFLPQLVCKHEYGHSIQSRILGPFYLFLIGIPSLLTSTTRVHEQMPWEKWADRLALDAKTN